MSSLEILEPIIVVQILHVTALKAHDVIAKVILVDYDCAGLATWARF